MGHLFDRFFPNPGCTSEKFKKFHTIFSRFGGGLRQELSAALLPNRWLHSHRTNFQGDTKNAAKGRRPSPGKPLGIAMWADFVPKRPKNPGRFSEEKRAARRKNSASGNAQLQLDFRFR